MKIKRVYLEITNACNLDCPFCSNAKGQSFMKLETVKDYLTQIKEFSDYVYLHVLGEPLLHNNIDDILDYCDEIDLNVQLVTNGTLLNQHLNILNHKSLRKLSISLHSINSTNANSNYYKTIQSIIETNSDTFIELRFYDFNNLKDELKEFKNYLFSKYNVTSTTKINSFKIKDKVYVYEQEMFNWPSLSDSFISNVGYCHGGIDQIAILNNGIVTSCCLDSNGHNKLGDLKYQTLKEILSSNEYLDFVDDLKNKKLSKELCQKCLYRLRFDDKHNSK